MADDAYSFRPMSRDDLPMVALWLAEPHVVEWWGDPDEQLALVSGDLEEPAMDQFIVQIGAEPFGYLQSFDLTGWPETAFGVQPAGARAIDQFIGAPHMVGRGHGSAFIRAFAGDLLKAGAPRVLTDPDPENARAIRAYEKAGFAKVRIVDTQDGPAFLMVRDI